MVYRAGFRFYLRTVMDRAALLLLAVVLVMV